MTDRVFGFGPAADDDITVVVFERNAGEQQWRVVHPHREPVEMPAFIVPALPERHEWTEQTLIETAGGWVRTYSEGSFELDREQVALMAATYQRLVREGKIFEHTTALSGHVERCRR